MRRIYVLIDHSRFVPYEPYVAKILKANPFLDQIYERSKGGQVSKRDLERMGIFFAAGPRYKMLEYEIEEDFFSHQRESSGPDVVDIAHERFMNRKKDPQMR